MLKEQRVLNLHHYHSGSSMDATQDIGNGKSMAFTCITQWLSSNTLNGTLLVCFLFVFGNVDVGMSIGLPVTI